MHALSVSQLDLQEPSQAARRVLLQEFEFLNISHWIALTRYEFLQALIDSLPVKT